MKKLKIILGDLRHHTVGRHSVFAPIGIGYIASYLLSKFNSEEVEVRLFDKPEEIFACIDDWNPDIIGLANYCWNTNLSKTVFEYAKNKNPKIISVSGGPEFPVDHEECRNYLLKRSELDLYVYREGEAAFFELVKKIKAGIDINDLKSHPQSGTMSINPESKELVVGEALPRLKNLDEIPSPYLTGLMDKWLNGNYAPAIEITRGCPFTCTYCTASYSWFNLASRFSVERMKQELSYLAERMINYPNVLLLICDTNFGMTEHDEKIAEHMSFLQDKYNWPNAFSTTTGKGNYDRILRVSSMLKNKMLVSVSVQTLNDKTLEVIKRRNLPLDKYKELQQKIKDMQMNAQAELIVPMPEETKESFLGAIKILLDCAVESITTYTCMLLKGTPLASKESREKYKMKTRFRLLPRQFGEYRGKKCFEIEEVCVANSTMSFDDYLDCRGLTLISALLADDQFNFIRKHLKELNLEIYDFMIQMWKIIKSGEGEVSSIYNGYIEESKKELFVSEEDIYSYFSNQENYNKLLSVELGDNLLRKYKTKMLLESDIGLIELAYFVLKDLNKNSSDQKIKASLAAAEQWVIANRNISAVIKNKSYREGTRELSLSHDVNAWYLADDQKSLILYEKLVNYRVGCDKEHVERVLKEMKNLYGDDLFYCIGQYLITHSSREFWCKSSVKVND